MNTEKIAKPSTATDREGFKAKTYVNAGAISKAFDISNYAEEATETQVNCNLCDPPLSKGRGVAKLCPGCTASGEKLAELIFNAAIQPRKVIRLQRCFCCNENFALSKFSVYFGICRKCFDERNKPKMTRGNFAEQVARNVRRVLGGAR